VSHKLLFESWRNYLLNEFDPSDRGMDLGAHGVVANAQVGRTKDAVNLSKTMRKGVKELINKYVMDVEYAEAIIYALMMLNKEAVLMFSGPLYNVTGMDPLDKDDDGSLDSNQSGKLGDTQVKTEFIWDAIARGKKEFEQAMDQSQYKLALLFAVFLLLDVIALYPFIALAKRATKVEISTAKKLARKQLIDIAQKAKNLSSALKKSNNKNLIDMARKIDTKLGTIQ
jgi:hypothetical protein